MRGQVIAALAGALLGASVATAITLAVNHPPAPDEVVIVRESPTTKTECIEIGGGKLDASRTVCTSQ